MHVFIVYCHPSDNSFTYQAKESFIKGLSDAGHTYEVSDLYEMKFNPVMSKEEYTREAFYIASADIPEDVKAEQQKIDQADIVTFIFPDFWTTAPAMLDGWFQRVWTFGYAYGEQRMKILDKAIFLMTMGGSLKDEIRQQQIDAIKCIMIGDRMRNRAKECEFYTFDEMTRGYSNDKNRADRCVRFSNEIYLIGKNL